MNAPISSLAPGVLAESHAARVTLAEPVGRLSLRARAGLETLAETLHLSLPTEIGQRWGEGARQVLCVGPDEWVIQVPQDDVAGLTAAAAGAYAAHPHSLVDVSGRELTLILDGPRAVELLTLGMPRDPDSIAIGQGRRTLIDGLTVVLWRDDTARFRIDVWHSFAPHLLHLLETGCRELAADHV